MIFGANNVISTYRLAASGDTAAFSGSVTVSGVEAYIEAASTELIAVLGEQPGIEVYLCHVEPGDFREGDKVVDAQSAEYRIVGIERHENNEDTDDVYVLRLHKEASHYA